MIDRGDIRQANRPLQQYLASLPGAGYGQFEYRPTAWLQNSKKGERWSERLIRAESPRLSPGSVYLHYFARLSWAVNHYRDNAITYKAQRDKNARELKLANAVNSRTCRCVSVMLLCLMQQAKELAMLCRKWCSAWWGAAAGRRRLHIKAVCQSVWSHHCPAWIMQPPPSTGRHRWTGLFHPQREVDHYAKNNWKEPRSILMSSADRAAHIDGHHAIIVSNTHALPAGV